MSVSVNVKRKFKVNGKEYDSVEEMPSDIRSAFEKAMASHTGLGKLMPSVAVQTKIIFNGEEYGGIDAMPQDVRRHYENVLKAAQTGTAPDDILTAAVGSDPAAGPELFTNISTGKPAVIRPAGFNIRTLIIGISVLAIIIFLYVFFRGG
ncbi:MAG: hypothetical protein EG826_07515 [Deltaproteobacteria bacterium]|nr:hypothetical protein [Deltaproteobacteria bacterium]